MSARQRAEATGAEPQAEHLTVSWRGSQFRLPRAEAFPLSAVEAEEGKHLTALRLILGDEQYVTWRELAATAADAEEFSTRVMRELGRGNP